MAQKISSKSGLSTERKPQEKRKSYSEWQQDFDVGLAEEDLYPTYDSLSIHHSGAWDFEEDEVKFRENLELRPGIWHPGTGSMSAGQKNHLDRRVYFPSRR